jgi:putative hydrolase
VNHCCSFLNAEVIKEHCIRDINLSDGMDISKVDLHTHTVLSGHAFSTLKEMTEAAARKGVEVLGVVEHCNPAKISGAVGTHYFTVIERVPKEMNGVRCLIGVEANILDENGMIDVTESDLKKCGIVIASIHKDTYEAENNLENNTRAICKALENKYVHVIGHPYANAFPCDIERISEAAVKNKKFLEINASNFTYKKKIGPETVSMVRKMVDITKENDWFNVVNSDAHISYDIADYRSILNLKDEFGLEEKNLLNCNMDILEKYFLTKLE